MPVSEGFYLFEDLETTGLVEGKDEPIEIASWLFDMKWNSVAKFYAKIQFDRSKMTPEAAEINHYNPEVWDREAIPYFKYDSWMKQNIPYPYVAIPIGHNVSYDRGILFHRHYKPTGAFMKWALHMIDTVGIALNLKAAGIIDVPDVKLETVVAALKIKVDAPPHSALGDMLKAKAIFDFNQGILKS